jgi:hypothetical protein
MAQHQEVLSYKANHDLLLEIFRITNEFIKGYKYTVGESLNKESIELSKTNETLIMCSNKGFSSKSSIMPRINFCACGKGGSTQSLTTAMLDHHFREVLMFRILVIYYNEDKLN